MTEELEGFESGRDQLAAVPKLPGERACRDGPRDPDAVEWCFQIAGAQPLGVTPAAMASAKVNPRWRMCSGRSERVPHPRNGDPIAARTSPARQRL